MLCIYYYMCGVSIEFQIGVEADYSAQFPLRNRRSDFRTPANLSRRKSYR